MTRRKEVRRIAIETTCQARLIEVRAAARELIWKLETEAGMLTGIIYTYLRVLKVGACVYRRMFFVDSCGSKISQEYTTFAFIVMVFFQ